MSVTFVVIFVWRVISRVPISRRHALQEPVRLAMPRRWNATESSTVITVSLRLPGVALLHLCARATKPPYQVSVSLSLSYLLSHPPQPFRGSGWGAL